MNDIYEALARTALLAELDIFGRGTSHRTIIDGLRATTARIIADRANVDSAAGQSALVTLYAQLAMLGLQIDLDVPPVPFRVRQPPLLDTDLPSSLLSYSADLLPGGSARPSPAPDVTFVLGDSPGGDKAVRVAGTEWTALVGIEGSGPRWNGDWPVGPIAAAAAAAVEGLRAAVPRIAEYLGRQAPEDERWRARPGRCVNLDLTRYQVDAPVSLGDVDVVSGGAITSAALYALLRMPVTSARMRIIEPDQLSISNLNRYALALRSMLQWPKTRMLETFQTSDIRITGFDERFCDSTATLLDPIAPRVLVGVDDIPSRWAAQRAAATRWLCVGASSHDFVLVSAHPADSACAGCVHPRDEDVPGEIPTISFVSLWAGLMQALELIANVARRTATPAGTVATLVWPFGLDNPRGIHRVTQKPVPCCPVRCAASTAQVAA